MTQDWKKSRTQLLAELTRLRKERDRLTPRGGDRSRAPVTNEAASARLSTMFQVSAALLSGTSLAEVASPILGELAELGGWDTGMLWLVNEPDGILYFAGSWHAARVDAQALESVSRQSTFRPGRGPLGNPWADADPFNQFDLALDSRSPRALYAVQAGLQWASYVPLRHHERLVGFMEFLGSEPSTPDVEHVKLLMAAGQQIVQRVLRERAEQQCMVLDTLVGPLVDFAVYELDTVGRVVRWGKDAERLKGFEADEVLGRHVSLFYPANEGQRADQNLAIAAARGFYKDGGWRIRKGAERFWADVIILPKREPHGELVGYTKVVHGLTVPEVAALTRQWRLAGADGVG